MAKIKLWAYWRSFKIIINAANLTEKQVFLKFQEFFIDLCQKDLDGVYNLINTKSFLKMVNLILSFMDDAFLFHLNLSPNFRINSIIFYINNYIDNLVSALSHKWFITNFLTIFWQD